MKKQINIEETFKETFEGFKVEPQASVWGNIQSQISSAPAGSTLSAAAGKTSIVAKTIIGIAVISGVSVSAYFLARGDQDKQQPKVEAEKVIPLQNEKEEHTVKEESAIDYEMESVPVEKENKVSKEEPKEGSKAVQLSHPKLGDPVEVVETENKKMATEEITAPTDQEVDGNVDNSADENKVDELKPAKKQSGSTSNEGAEDIQQDPTSDIQQNTSSKPLVEEEMEIHNIIPNIFTPNQDGHNDVFRIETEEADNLEVSIFDKKGAKIFEWEGLYGFWDGRFPSGEMAADDVYFYQVILKKGSNSTVKKGMVLLKK